jgi:phosphoribosyl 1,2-cyclic phosphodiesterase
MMDRPPHRTLLFLSHVHLDHIMGIPFLKPLWHEEWLTDFFCGGLKGLGGVETYLTTLFSPPLFPVPLSLFPGRKTFHDLMAGQILDFEGFQITTFPLNHPDTALGFRLDVAGKSIAYVTDTEHIPGTRDPHILKGVAGVDLMIYVRLAESAEVKKIALYHHCPEHPDASLEVIEKNIIALFPSSFVAREGQILKFTDL